MNNMRPDGTGENMVCNDCYKRNAPSRGTATVSEMAAEISSKSVKKPSEKTEKMLKYLCTGCKYKFSRKASQEVTKCPYCGKNNIVMDNQLGADKLITDSEDRRFENW